MEGLPKGRGMKLLAAIVQDQDANLLMRSLSESNLRFTKISSTGGFLREGNTALLIGLEETLVEKALSIIKKTCHTRERFMDMSPLMGSEIDMSGFPIKVVVGGAVVFILNVEGAISV